MNPQNERITIEEALKRLNRHAIGTALPEQAGSITFETYIDALDTAQQAWGEEPGMQWQELLTYWETPLTVMSVYSIPVLRVSTSKLAFVAIRWMEDGKSREDRYSLTPPDVFAARTGVGGTGANSNICTIANGELIFPQGFEASDRRLLNNATVRVPHYRRPDRIRTNTPLSTMLQCPSGNFVVYYAAAELVSQGFIKEDRRDEFFQQAASRMDDMKQENNSSRKTVRSSWRSAGRSTIRG